MTIKPSWKPWHEVVQLRGDLKTGELSLAVFAADLYDVVMQNGQDAEASVEHSGLSTGGGRGLEACSRPWERRRAKHPTGGAPGGGPAVEAAGRRALDVGAP